MLEESEVTTAVSVVTLHSPIRIILAGYAAVSVDWEEQGAHALLEKLTNTKELLPTIDTLLRGHQHLGSAGK